MSASASANDGGVEIREVWESNLEAEFAVILDIVDESRYVSMDTEYPGVVYFSDSSVGSNAERNYGDTKANADELKLIQLGFTFSDESGALPARGTGGRACAWQFNFRDFNPLLDPSNFSSIELLRTSGINFDRFATEGVDRIHFAELLMSSGVLLNSDLHWVTFHGGSDCAYLLRLLTGRNLPDNVPEFFMTLRIFCPVLYDVKYLMRLTTYHGGLNRLAQVLNVERVGTSHQAGSDSLVTMQCFQRLKVVYFRESIEKHAHLLYGLPCYRGE